MWAVSVGITKWFFYNQCQGTLKLFWEYVMTRIPGFSFNLQLVCFWASSHLVLFQSVSTELYNDEIPAQQPKEIQIFNKTFNDHVLFYPTQNQSKACNRHTYLSDIYLHRCLLPVYVCLMLRQVDQSLAQLSDRKPHIILMQNLWLDQLLQAAESLKQWSNSNIFTTMIHSWHELVLLKSCLWSAPNMFTVTVVELSCLNLIFITDEWVFFSF